MPGNGTPKTPKAIPPTPNVFFAANGKLPPANFFLSVFAMNQNGASSTEPRLLNTEHWQTKKLPRLVTLPAN